jgi:hypothetical protein
MLTRQQMVDVINGGGSVLHNGQILTHVSQLPGEEVIAQTEEEKAEAAAKLKSEIEALQARLATITPSTVATPPAPVKAATPPPAPVAPKPAKAEA